MIIKESTDPNKAAVMMHTNIVNHIADSLKAMAESPEEDFSIELEEIAKYLTEAPDRKWHSHRIVDILNMERDITVFINGKEIYFPGFGMHIHMLKCIWQDAEDSGRIDNLCMCGACEEKRKENPPCKCGEELRCQGCIANDRLRYIDRCLRDVAREIKSEGE